MKEKFTEKYYSELADKIYLNFMTKEQAFIMNWLSMVR